MENEVALNLKPAKPVLTIRRAGCFAFLPDGERLVVAKPNGDPQARVLSLKTGEEVVQCGGLPVNLRRIAVSDNGRFLAFGRMERDVTLCDAQTGKVAHRLQVKSDGEISGLSFAPQSETLVHATWRGLTVIDAVEGRILRTIAVQSGNTFLPPRYYALSFSLGGDRLAVGWSVFHSSSTQRHRVSIFAWPSGEEIKQFLCSEDPNKVTFAPDGKSLVTKLSDGRFEARRLTTGRPFFKLLPLAENVASAYFGTLAFSPDGTLMAYGQGAVLALWSWTSRQLLGAWRLPGRSPLAFDAAFSPDGEQIAVADRTTIFLYPVTDLYMRG